MSEGIRFDHVDSDESERRGRAIFDELLRQGAEENRAIAADLTAFLTPVEEEGGHFFPPENEYSRLSMRHEITGGYRNWGFVSEDEMLLLSDKGHVYLRIDETTLNLDVHQRTELQNALIANFSDAYAREDAVLEALRPSLKRRIRPALTRRMLRSLSSGRHCKMLSWTPLEAQFQVDGV
jgi:hypothetical protein